MSALGCVQNGSDLVRPRFLYLVATIPNIHLHIAKKSRTMSLTICPLKVMPNMSPRHRNGIASPPDSLVDSMQFSQSVVRALTYRDTAATAVIESMCVVVKLSTR